MKTIQIRLKETNNTGTTLEKKLRSSVHTQAARGKIELHLKKLRRKVEVDRIKYIEVNRANNVLLAVALRPLSLFFLSDHSFIIESTLNIRSDEAARDVQSNSAGTCTRKYSLYILRLIFIGLLFKGSATSLPIFCVGSRDYLGCLRLQTNPPLVFRQESEVTRVR